jgi:hypothetical protein
VSCHNTRALLALTSLVAFAGCGDLPRPFAGHPGATAMRLAQPPPARLAVPSPGTALLSDGASVAYAADLVGALQAKEVPAVAGRARRGDWVLTVSAELRGDKVVPSYEVANPAGVSQGVAEGAPVNAAAWSQGTAGLLQQSATAAAPNIAALLTRIEAARRQSDPNSLTNRPARVVIHDVTGAPGDGNNQLTRQIRQRLPQMGEVVQDTEQGADYIVAGEVRMAAGAKGAERVEIQWVVSDVRGGELGRVVQLNEVEPGSLDRQWGDVALVVAQEAATGIRDVILNQNGGRASAVPPAASARVK